MRTHIHQLMFIYKQSTAFNNKMFGTHHNVLRDPILGCKPLPLNLKCPLPCSVLVY
jgi:hypothetical protein